MKEERDLTIITCLTVFVFLVLSILIVICFHFGIINAGVELANMYFIIRKILGVFLIILGVLFTISLIIIIIICISVILNFIHIKKNNKYNEENK
jgi:hypothetical protein